MVINNKAATISDGQTITQLVVRLNARYTALADVSGVFIVGLAHQLDYYGGAAS